jgi:adenosylhomocysteine nucleosidase
MDGRPFFAQHEIPLLGHSTFKTCPVASKKLLLGVTEFFKNGWTNVQTEAARNGINLSQPQGILGAIASGDKFFANHTQLAELTFRLPWVRCVEMEGAAVAQVCYEYGIPFSIVRTISDRADHSAPVDFPTFVTHVASHYSYGIIKNYLSQNAR